MNFFGPTEPTERMERGLCVLTDGLKRRSWYGREVSMLAGFTHKKICEVDPASDDFVKRVRYDISALGGYAYREALLPLDPMRPRPSIIEAELAKLASLPEKPPYS